MQKTSVLAGKKAKAQRNIKGVQEGLARTSVSRNTHACFSKHVCSRLRASVLQATNKAPWFSMADVAELKSTRKEWGELLSPGNIRHKYVNLL